MSGDDSNDKPYMAEVHCLCTQLLSPDRFVRKIALSNLLYFIQYESDLSPSEHHEIFVVFHAYFLNTLRDSSEVVREEGIKLIGQLVHKLLPNNDFYLSHIMPVLLERLGNPEIVEDSEELRLQLVGLVYDIIGIYQPSNLVPVFADICTMLQHTVLDKYPLIKILSCKCIARLAQILPEPFLRQAVGFAKPVLITLKHQQHKVRINSINCLGEIILHAHHEVLDEILVGLAARVFDPVPAVRLAVFKVVGMLLLSYKDRYSFFHKLLPLLLTGLSDELGSVSDEAQELWAKVGLQYARENEKDLKDQLDYLSELPPTYPPALVRPSLGCRVLVQRNISKISPALCKELVSWQGDVRLKCSHLLRVIALHAEDGIIQHLPALLKVMCIAIRDRDKIVVNNVFDATKVMAGFVPVDTWSQLILGAIEGGTCGAIQVLAGFIYGARTEEIAPYLLKITEAVLNKKIVYVKKTVVQVELKSCIEAIQTHYSVELPERVWQLVFHAIIAVLGNTAEEIENLESERRMFDHMPAKLASVMNCEAEYDVWSRFLPGLLKELNSEEHTWTGPSFEFEMLAFVLTKSRRAFGENLDMISELLKKALHTDVDPQLRLSIFAALYNALENKEVTLSKAESSDDFFFNLIQDILLPAIVWKAGKVAVAMRSLATAGLSIALSFKEDMKMFTTLEMLEPLSATLLPVLISLLDDAEAYNRSLALDNIRNLMQHMTALKIWKMENLLDCYPQVIKCLDDPVRNVRVLASNATARIFMGAPAEFFQKVHTSHHEFIADTLFVYFDDTDEDFTFHICIALKVMAGLNTRVVQEKLEKHRLVMRNQQGCDELEKYIKDL